MLDLQFICDNRDEVEQNCDARGVTVDIAAVVQLREERNRQIVAGDDLRRQAKEVSSKIPKASAEERPGLIEQGKQLREQVSAAEATQKETEAKLREVQSQIPNMTHPDVPVGGEDDASEVHRWGDFSPFDFPALDHVSVAEKLDLIDFEAGSRVAGTDFTTSKRRRNVGDGIGAVCAHKTPWRRLHALYDARPCTRFGVGRHRVQSSR